MQFLVQNLGIAMQPADARPVGRFDRQIQRNSRCRQPVLDGGQQRFDPLAGRSGDQKTRPLRRAAGCDIAKIFALLGIEAVDLVPDLDDALAGAGVGIDASGIRDSLRYSVGAVVDIHEIMPPFVALIFDPNRLDEAPP